MCFIFKSEHVGGDLRFVLKNMYLYQNLSKDIQHLFFKHKKIQKLFYFFF